MGHGCANPQVFHYPATSIFHSICRYKAMGMPGPRRLIRVSLAALALTACAGKVEPSANVLNDSGMASDGAGRADATRPGDAAGGNSDAGRVPPVKGIIDSTTLTHKFVMGYQGWFACPGDGSPANRWVHWFRGQTPTAANLTVDMWPDTSELGSQELFDTGMTLTDGTVAKFYSAWPATTVERHFSWMRDAGLDGVVLQRFVTDLADPSMLRLRNQVVRNVRSGAEKYGRVFAVMYDVTGANAATLLDDLKRDWSSLAGTLRVTESDRYLHHQGKPLMAIWGLGFRDRAFTPEQAQAIISYFKREAPPAEQVTLLGGVPANWRTLSGDSQTDPAWTAVYESFDVLTPWSVGRYMNDATADNFRTQRIEPDLVATRTLGVDYMPVVFPGFSWTNLRSGPLNQIPRQGGTFYWHQIDNALRAGASMLFGAMFDEVDEGTALYKIAPTPADQPAGASFVPLNIDGQALPSDWYLRLTGAASAILRGNSPPSATIPIMP
jgi:hypothetical protein